MVDSSRRKRAPPSGDCSEGPRPSRGPWHVLTSAEALARLGSRASGLSDDEATRRLDVSGRNRLSPPPTVSAAALLAAQFRGVVVLLLVSATVLSLALGDIADAVAIGVVLAINATLGFVLELRARRAMEALLHLGATRASAVRDGVEAVIDAELLVPGDVIAIQAGLTVPADARLLEGTDLRTNEAALTGESLPVGKDAAAIPGDDTPLADRRNLVFRGTTVAAGFGRAVVTETGDDTEVGRIGALVHSVAAERTPLERRLDALGGRLAWLALGVAALVGLVGMLQGSPWALMVETAIALAVAAVPEGLPAVATITLAVGLRRMARRQALVRRLSAVEALGSTTVVCTDKTRTLTTGEMSVVHVWTAGTDYVSDNRRPDPSPGEPLRQALATAVRASRQGPPDTGGTRRAASADPVDTAIITAAASTGLDVAALLSGSAARIPFSSGRKFSAAFDGGGDAVTAFVKGAPETVMDMCAAVLTPAGLVPLDESMRSQLRAANDALAGDGLRVLATASGAVPAADVVSLGGLTFVALIGMMDPPAPGVKDTIVTLRRAGLRVVMLTGDQRRTAEAVGRRLGLLSPGDTVIDSRDWIALSPAAREARLPTAAAFSRISAEDKLTIVAALQQQGIVAMLGDGINDAPALRKADVGVAMGLRGTDVAKDAAAIVLQDDRFETIAAAVEEGRVIGDNIRKFVFYLFSCNLAEVLVLLVAGLAGLPLPLLPLQILWLNLVTDTFPALALAVEVGDEDVMARPPRDPQEAILSTTFVLRVAFYAILITASTLAALYWGSTHPGAGPTTMAFMTLALAQILHLGNARSDRPVLTPAAALSNRFAIAAVLASVALQILPLYVPWLGGILQVAPLSPGEWLVVIACSSVTALAGQALKAWRPRRSA